MTEEDEEVGLSTVIRLPRKTKDELRVICTRRGLAMKDYVERLVRSALGVPPLETSRERMSPPDDRKKPYFEEERRCKYGCNYRSRSKSGLSQHEAECIFQKTATAQEKARQVEARRAGLEENA